MPSFTCRGGIITEITVRSLCAPRGTPCPIMRQPIPPLSEITERFELEHQRHNIITWLFHFEVGIPKNLKTQPFLYQKTLACLEKNAASHREGDNSAVGEDFLAHRPVLFYKNDLDSDTKKSKNWSMANRPMGYKRAIDDIPIDMGPKDLPL